MGKERRRFPRVYLKIPCEYKGESIWQEVVVENISLGGVFIVTDKVEPPGTEVELIFKFGKKEERTIMARGRVVWCREKSCCDSSGKVLSAGMGVEFVKLQPLTAREFLQKEIESWGKDG